MGEARNQGIRTMTNILVPQEVNLEQNDICSLLLNLLNNAIEGSAGVKDADIQLTMFHAIVLFQTFYNAFVIADCFVIRFLPCDYINMQGCLKLIYFPVHLSTPRSKSGRSAQMSHLSFSALSACCFRCAASLQEQL